MDAFSHAYVCSTIYEAGKTEDGRPFIAERFQVAVENERGDRLIHKVYFNGTQPEYIEEDGFTCFPDLRQEAEAKAEQLATRINAALRKGFQINLDYWYADEPVYGSDAYIAKQKEEAFLNYWA